MSTLHPHAELGRRGQDRQGVLAPLDALVRAVRERAMRHATAQALAQERRRLAADVHDLVMQELIVALASARTLLDHPATAHEASSVVVAGERALAAAREIVGDLTRREREPITVAVERSARAAAAGTPLRFEASGVHEQDHTDRATCDALVHIAREAVRNAVKHGRPTSMTVALEREDEWRLTVADDGCGFEPAVTGQGFGLDSMSRAARALGGSLCLRSAPGVGTRIEAVLP